ERLRLAVFGGYDHAAVRVQRVFRVDQLAMPGGQEGGARTRRLLVTGEHDDEVAVGIEAFAFQADEVGDQYGGPGLVVRRAASVPPAVFLRELVGLDGPVAGERFDHVHVRHHEQRPPGGVAAAIARDEIHDAVGGADDGDVVRGEARVAQP